jgi:hypothetical protein
MACLFHSYTQSLQGRENKILLNAESSPWTLAELLLMYYIIRTSVVQLSGAFCRIADDR